LQVEIEILSS